MRYSLGIKSAFLKLFFKIVLSQNLGVNMKAAFSASLLTLALASTSASVSAAPYFYVDWTASNIAGGTASGLITLPDLSTVTVNFKATFANGNAGNLYGSQTNGGTDYWNPSAPYTSAQVDNRPPGTDLLQLSGGQNQIYTVTLGAAIKDPIMAIVSLGQPNTPTSYDFDSPFTIVSQGSGYWGGNGSALQQLAGDVLRGNEGHGTIQFLGTFTTFSWTVPTPESWHGFTFGIRTTEAIEPTNPIPEPGSMALVGLALAGLATIRKRKTS